MIIAKIGNALAAYPAAGAGRFFGFLFVFAGVWTADRSIRGFAWRSRIPHRPLNARSSRLAELAHRRGKSAGSRECWPQYLGRNRDI